MTTQKKDQPSIKPKAKKKAPARRRKAPAKRKAAPRRKAPAKAKPATDDSKVKTEAKTPDRSTASEPDGLKKQQGNSKGHQFQPGQSGNPRGRPRGRLNKTTRLIQELLDQDIEDLTEALKARALKGSTEALKIIFDRLAPAPRDRPIEFELPEVKTPADLANATSSLLAQVATGRITPSEAETVGRLLDRHAKSIELLELETRIAQIEQMNGINPGDSTATNGFATH